MRYLQVQVDRADAERVVEIEAEHKAFSPAIIDVRRAADDEAALVMLTIPNDQVGGFLAAVADAVEGAEFLLPPQGTIPVQTPLAEAVDRAQNVTRRSTVELVLSTLQSLGAWQSMLLYAAFSGVVAAYGLITSTTFLLVAGMLIAPLGALAMVCVVAAAIGDGKIFLRGALRFWVALVVVIGAAALLGFLYRIEVATPAMEQITSLSAWTVLIALVSGTAGAHTQIQSERSSLVTSTATGFLIAVALALPASVLGLAVVLRRWDYVYEMAFVMVLMFTGFVAGGALTLLLYGVRPQDKAVRRGVRSLQVALTSVIALLAFALVAWQIPRTPELRKVDISHDAEALARTVVREISGVRLVQVRAQFTRPDLEEIGGEALLMRVLITSEGAGEVSEDAKAAVRRAVAASVQAAYPEVRPFIDITAVQ